MTASYCLNVSQQLWFVACMYGVTWTWFVSGRGRTPSRSSLGNTLSFLDKDRCTLSLIVLCTTMSPHFWESSQTNRRFVFQEMHVMNIILKLLLAFLTYFYHTLRIHSKKKGFDLDLNLHFMTLILLWENSFPALHISISLSISLTLSHIQLGLTGIPVFHIQHFHIL